MHPALKRHVPHPPLVSSFSFFQASAPSPPSAPNFYSSCTCAIILYPLHHFFSSSSSLLFLFFRPRPTLHVLPAHGARQVASLHQLAGSPRPASRCHHADPPRQVLSADARRPAPYRVDFDPSVTRDRRLVSDYHRTLVRVWPDPSWAYGYRPWAPAPPVSGAPLLLAV